MVTSQVLASQVRNYLKTNNLSLKLRLVKGMFVIDNVHIYFFGNCADLCECATGIKFENVSLSMAIPVFENKGAYSLKEISAASLSILNENSSNLEQKLLYTAKWCWSYVNKFSDFSSEKNIQNAWQAAYFHVITESKFFVGNIMPI
jgi:hypothetical protein